MATARKNRMAFMEKGILAGLVMKMYTRDGQIFFTENTLNVIGNKILFLLY